MSKELRRQLENVAVKCSLMEPHSAASDLERILGGKINDDWQEVVYPGQERCWCGGPLGHSDDHDGIGGVVAR